jgi:hypothetical protein
LVHFYVFSFPFGFANVAMGMIVCFILQCLTFFWNRYEVPAVALRDHVFRGNEQNIGDTATVRHHSRSNSNQLSSFSPPNAPDVSGGDPIDRSPDSSRGVLLQGAQSPIRYTYSQGTFSLGYMSRNSELMFQGPGEADDDSCRYFLGGEVVIRGSGDQLQRGTFLTATTAVHNRGDHSGDSAARMATYDSMSTLQSAVPQLGTIADDAGTSSLQAIFDPTPRHYSSPEGAANVLNPTSSVASFSTQDSARLRNRGRNII